MSILSEHADIVPDWVIYQNSEQFIKDICMELRKCKNRIGKFFYVVADNSSPLACVDSMVVVFDYKENLNGFDVELDYEKAAIEVRQKLFQKHPGKQIVLESSKIRFQ